MNVLIIAAHPDDEILGCGATVAQLIEDGYNVKTVILGLGMLSRGVNPINVELLRKNAIDANLHIGIKDISFYEFPDNAFDTVKLLDIVRVIEKELKDSTPDLIFTHFGSDLNIDHRITFEAVLTACRPQPDLKKPSIYSFYIPSSSDWTDGYVFKPFIPNVFNNVSKTINKKISALSCYRTEMRRYPHSRSLESLEIFSQYWGNRVGLEYVEPFMQVRGWKIC